MQLLQPLNLTPLQPQLAETSLQILEGAGPAEPSFNEFNPLFTRDRWTTQFSAVAGGQRTLSDELTVAGLSGRYSFSLGQFHYETDGFRTNNDLEHNIYNAFAQVAVSADTSLQIELRHQESFTGDLAQNFDPNTVDEVIRNEIFTDTARFGIHHRLGAGDDLVASVIYRDIDNDDFSSITGVDGSTFIDNGFSAAGTYSLEVQHQRRDKRFNLITGAGHLDQDRSLTRVIIMNDTVIPVSIPEVDAQHTNAYLYSNVHLLENLISTLGVSYDAFDGEVLDLNRVNPKLGFWWRPWVSTTLRAAWFTTVKRPFASNQTIEPTQVAGFNQFLDDTDGSKTARYGAGLDHAFHRRVYGGIEASWRDLERPLASASGNIQFEISKEQLHRAYLYATPTDRIALSTEYFLEDFDRDLPSAASAGELTRLISHRVPLTFNYYDPSGLSASLKATYVNQDVELAEERAVSVQLTPDQVNPIQGNEDFWVVDVLLGYRLPKRWGIVTFGVKNLLDEEFRFQDTRFSSNEPTPPLFQPDRILFTQFTLAF